MNDESELATQREQRPMLPEDHIGLALSESHANGELRSAPSYGKPLSWAMGRGRAAARGRTDARHRGAAADLGGRVRR